MLLKALPVIGMIGIFADLYDTVLTHVMIQGCNIRRLKTARLRFWTYGVVRKNHGFFQFLYLAKLNFFKLLDLDLSRLPAGKGNGSVSG